MKKRIVVSGAGSGIGRATALTLAQAGHAVYLLGRNQQRLEETLKLLPNRDHAVLLADIRDKSSLAKALSSVTENAIDGLVAASGIGGWNFWGDEDRWDDVIMTNLTGTYNFVNTFYPLLKKSDAGYKSIVVITSALGSFGVPDFQALSASKAGLHGLVRTWAVQWAADKIAVNAISPGWVNTDMAAKAIHAFSEAYSISLEEANKAALQQVPLKKMTEADEIAQLVNYMIHQQSMTGSIVNINGGLVMNG